MNACYRICASCGHANEVRAYACTACRSSLSGTIPGPLPEGITDARPLPEGVTDARPLPEDVTDAQPAEEDSFALWAAETETAIAEAETRCQKCQALAPVVRFPFALASTEWKLDLSRTFASAAGKSDLMLLVEVGILVWKWKEQGVAFRMNLVLCTECAYNLEDFYGRVPRDSYRLHPCYAGLEDHGFSRFVSEAEFKNWKDIPPK